MYQWYVIIGSSFWGFWSLGGCLYNSQSLLDGPPASRHLYCAEIWMYHSHTAKRAMTNYISNLKQSELCMAINGKLSTEFWFDWYRWTHFLSKKCPATLINCHENLQNTSVQIYLHWYSKLIPDLLKAEWHILRPSQVVISFSITYSFDTSDYFYLLHLNHIQHIFHGNVIHLFSSMLMEIFHKIKF